MFSKSNAAPLISVCVPVYDTEPFLERCLRSAAEQDFDNFEIVVASDASRGKDARGRNAKKIVKAIKEEVGDLALQEHRPVLLTSMDIRRYVRKLIEMEMYELPVLSHQELTEEITIRPLGKIHI